MASDSPLQISRLLIAAMGIQMYLHHRDRVPQTGATLVVSNHRSFLDAPLLMSAIDRPIRFACHHYMGQVPVMREVVTKLGCFPLARAGQRQQSFFHQAIQLLKTQQAVGVFPEGTEPMVNSPTRCEMGDFQRGFAHLALKAPVQDLAVLPIAIAVQNETKSSAVPLKLLSFFDPSEPLFNQEGWHPLVVYQRVNVLVGRPFWITPSHRQKYQGKGARTIVQHLTGHCHNEISSLLLRGCY
ncbi:MAG: 1-acyl-sn-glycerol-3-phosphate acyltransferase [Phormidesmis sp. CAN_BIN36]|nr:1-acyl-sn-glycerol-3-phosphate acyltransferase [Phormidesmis sp. CAN_BIN36]